MNKYGLTFHHLGLATFNSNKTIEFVSGLGYSIGETIYDQNQKIDLTLCTSQKMPDIEIVAKKDNNGPLEAILKKDVEHIYHTCYETTNLEQSLDAIKTNNRVILVTKPTIAQLFLPKYVSFYLINGFGLIELLSSSI